MTLDKIIGLAKTRGPWKVLEGPIRNSHLECPIHAAASAQGYDVYGAYTGGQAMGVPSHEIKDIVCAADYDKFEDAHLRSIRQQLIEGLEAT